MTRDHWTLKAMSVYGGGFVKALALCFERADSENYARLKNTFPEYWKDYTKFGEDLRREHEKSLLVKDFILGDE